MQRIFDKTNKGREEIATRQYRLAPRLRTLLLLIDGKQTTGQLLQKIAGLDETSITELLDGGFIQGIDLNAPSEPIEDQDAPAAEPETPNPENPAPDEPVSEFIGLAEGETKFQAIHNFYTETIRTTLGLRGYNFQLKVDEAQSLDDLRALHDPYIAAVIKIKGDEIARNLHLQLEHLFGLEDLPKE